MEPFFRIIFWVIFASMLVLQAYFASRARLAGARGTAARQATAREGRGCAVARAIRSLLLVAFLLLYVINPSWLSVLSIPFPDWLRWTGAGLGVASLALYAWSRATLGREWSSPLRLREKHQLVSGGPYARIRHPIYLALLGFLASIALIAANGFLVALLAFSIVDLSLRIPREEQMMAEEFGEAYRAYAQRTGRFLPK